MRVDYADFDQRADRYAYLVRTFSGYLEGQVLDVGCDQAYLRKVLGQARYTGIDRSGNPDLRLDLETTERLPFEDGAFDCVICSDVLEHLYHLHRVFGEAVRVARRYLVVSLPNNWANARRVIERGKGKVGHYGLPPDPPGDRHKWFFGLTEALAFARAQEENYPVRIVELCVTEKSRAVVVRVLRRLRYRSRERYLNRYAHTLWIVFAKERGTAPVDSAVR